LSPSLQGVYRGVNGKRFYLLLYSTALRILSPSPVDLKTRHCNRKTS